MAQEIGNPVGIDDTRVYDSSMTATQAKQHEAEIRTEIVGVTAAVDQVHAVAGRLEERFGSVCRGIDPKATPETSAPPRSTDVGNTLQNLKFQLQTAIERLNDLADRCEL